MKRTPEAYIVEFIEVRSLAGDGVNEAFREVCYYFRKDGSLVCAVDPLEGQGAETPFAVVNQAGQYWARFRLACMADDWIHLNQTRYGIEGAAIIDTRFQKNEQDRPK